MKKLLLICLVSLFSLTAQSSNRAPAGEASYPYSDILAKLDRVSSKISLKGSHDSTRRHARYGEVVKVGIEAILQGKAEDKIILMVCEEATYYEKICLKEFSKENSDNKYNEAYAVCTSIDSGKKDLRLLAKCLLRNY